MEMYIVNAQEFVLGEITVPTGGIDFREALNDCADYVKDGVYAKFGSEWYHVDELRLIDEDQLLMMYE